MLKKCAITVQVKQVEKMFKKIFVDFDMTWYLPLGICGHQTQSTCQMHLVQVVMIWFWFDTSRHGTGSPEHSATRIVNVNRFFAKFMT